MTPERMKELRERVQRVKTSIRGDLEFFLTEALDEIERLTAPAVVRDDPTAFAKFLEVHGIKVQPWQEDFLRKYVTATTPQRRSNDMDFGDIEFRRIKLTMEDSTDERPAVAMIFETDEQADAFYDMNVRAMGARVIEESEKLDGTIVQTVIAEDGTELMREKPPHRSDCALHNGPAEEPGPCDCGADPGMTPERYGSEFPQEPPFTRDDMTDEERQEKRDLLGDEDTK